MDLFTFLFGKFSRCKVMRIWAFKFFMSTFTLDLIKKSVGGILWDTLRPYKYNLRTILL